MTCQELEPLIGAYADGELDLERTLAVEGHVAECVGCAAALRSLQALSKEIRSAPYYAAPPGLKSRLRTTSSPQMRDVVRRPRRLALAWFAVAASVVVVAVVSTVVVRRLDATSADREVRAVVDRHLASLMADHLMDVASTDRHTVKPWFTGRIDFSPPVPDLVGDGFPLKGGRLDYVDGHPAIALVYSRGQHVINVFAWPAADTQPGHQALDDGRGHHVVHWTASGLAWWVVSDVSAADLTAFATKLAAEAALLQRP